MAKSANLKLDYLAPAQAQKHVTVNEGFAALDSIVQLAVLGLHRNDPPATPAEGDRWIVGPVPDADWSGQTGRLATFRTGGWVFSAPAPGWRLYDLATDRLLLLGTGLTWEPVAGGGGSGPVTEVQDATRIGLGTTADAATPFAARLNAALWDALPVAEGGSGDLFLALNRAAATGDAGLVFQTGYATGAVAGLTGSDRFRVAVSADGTTFRDGLAIDTATGVLDLPQLPRFKARTNFDNYVAEATWTTIAINEAETNGQGAFDPATGRFTAPVAGDYLLGATLLYKINASSSSKMRGRLLRNGTTEIEGSYGENSSFHVTEATALWLQTLAPLAAGDTVELQGYFRSADGYFAAGHTSFWGFKVG
jgi:hypothetical protein